VLVPNPCWNKKNPYPTSWNKKFKVFNL
jgi:hypothetical protein